MSMMPYTTTMKKISAIMMFVWMLALFLRSGIYLGRIRIEFQTPYKDFLPHIQACTPSAEIRTDEEQYVQWYRSVGETCAN